MLRTSRPIGALLICLGIAAPAIAADPPASVNFSSEPIAECARVLDMHMDDAGSLFLACSGLITTFDASEDFDFHVIKLDRGGGRDIRWGTAGIATFRGNTTTSACNRFDCKLAYSSPARDGGFLIALSSGRIIRFLPTGLLDASYLGQYAAGSKRSELPNPQSWQLVGVSLQSDGGLVSLSARRSKDSGIQTLLLRHLRTDGSYGGEMTYTLEDAADIVSWSTGAVDLDLLLKPADTQEAAPLRRMLLVPVASEGTPNFDQAGFVDPSFYVLGDGKLMFGSPVRIYKWRADGNPDSDFGNHAEPGFRTNPSAAYPPHCQPPPLTPRLSLRGRGDATHYFSTYFILRGLACTGSWFSLISDNGRSDTFANATPVLAPPGFALSYGANLPIRVDNAGGIIFPAVTQNGMYQLARIEGPGAAGTRARADVRVIEYYNETLDHYFMTAHEHEVAFVDQGNAGPGWKRTGHLFGAFNIDTFVQGAETVCRYYGDPVGGPNSHFYSAEKFECDALSALDSATPQGKPAWRFERDAFRVGIPVNGKCAGNLTPIYRLYNRGSERGIESNHRYVSSLTEYAAMQAKGWAGEGVHMCATHS